MSVLGITDNFDLFFNKIWEVHAMNWAEDKQAIQKITQHMMDVFVNRGDEWARLFNVSHATRQYYSWDGLAPAEYVDTIETMCNSLKVVMDRVAPEYKYVKIEFIFRLQGGDVFLPTIDVMMGKTEFDTHFRDWAPVSIHIGHKAINYPGYQGSRKDPLPTPKFSDYIDTVNNSRDIPRDQKIALGWKQFPKHRITLKWGD